jgi:hypothetical protein
MESLNKKYWADKNNIDKYMLIIRKNQDNDIYYIFKITEFIQGDYINMPVYNVKNAYYFNIQNNNKIKCFCYDGLNSIYFDKKDIVYIIPYEKYLDIFRFFVFNEGKFKSDINLNEFENMLK